MGAPRVSIARLTISIARSTPAQKPRGLASTISMRRLSALFGLAALKEAEQHQADRTAHDRRVGDVERRPGEALVIPLDEVDDVAVLDAVDQVAQGAADDQ